MRKGILPAIPALALVIALFAAACGGDSSEDPTPTNEPTGEVTRSASTTSDATSQRVTRTPEPGSPAAGTPTAGTTPSPEATAQPAFTPFPDRRADGEPQTDRCGTYYVLRESAEKASDNTPRADIVTISTGEGVFVVELKNDEPFSYISVDWCYDLNADGLPELSVSTFSGGAHCCTTQAIYTFNGPKSELFMLYEAGNAGPLLPQELNGGAPIELTGFDDRLAYYGELAYAVSPTLVIVYAYEGGEYVEATADFPEVVDQYRNQLVALFQTCESSEGAVECQKGVGLGIMAESIILGDWDEFAATLDIGDEARAWLDANEAQVTELVSEPKPAAGTP